MAYSIEVSFDEEKRETVVVNADNQDDGEFFALNSVRDGNPDAKNVQVIGVLEV